MNHQQLLETVFSKASACDSFSIPNKIKDDLVVIANQSKRQKGVFTVLTTLFIHRCTIQIKILEDINLV